MTPHERERALDEIIMALNFEVCIEHTSVYYLSNLYSSRRCTHVPILDNNLSLFF